MLMAFTIWLLSKFGIHPTAEDFRRYDQMFRERGHHLTLDFGGHRTGTTRWTDSEFTKRPAIGLGYEYLVDRRYNGVGIEVLAQSLGRFVRDGGAPNSVFLGAGLAYYPIRHLRVFTQAGAEIDFDGNEQGVGRAGLGWRFMFFMTGVQPFFYVETTTNGQFGWAINIRFEF